MKHFNQHMCIHGKFVIQIIGNYLVNDLMAIYV